MSEVEAESPHEAEWDTHGFPDGWNPFDPASTLVYNSGETQSREDVPSQVSPLERYELLLREAARVACLTKSQAAGMQEAAGSMPGFYFVGSPLEEDAFVPLNGGKSPINAKLAGDFLSSVAVHLLPLKARDPSVFKDFRTILLSGRTNMSDFSELCKAQPDYVAVFDDLCMDTLRLMRDRDGRTVLEHRDLTGKFHRCSIGEKLWHLLRDADMDLIIRCLNQLLQHFIDSYHEFGGPLLDLDQLRGLVLLSAACDLVSLVESMPQIYEWRPKAEWRFAVCRLEELKVLPGAPPCEIWASQQVTRLFNVVALIAYWELKQAVFRCVLFGYGIRVLAAFEEPRVFRAILQDGLDVRVEPDNCAPLVCNCPCGLDLVGKAGSPDSEFIRVGLPVLGWIQVHAVECLGSTSIEAMYANPFSLYDDAQKISWLLTIAHFARSKYLADPLGKCGIASKLLLQTMQNVLSIRGHTVESYFKWGTLKLVDGSFLAMPVGKPSEHGAWWPHSFLFFDGPGTIIDITADQFKGNEPQLWFPADPSRYSFSMSEANRSGKNCMADPGLPPDKKPLIDITSDQFSRHEPQLGL